MTTDGDAGADVVAVDALEPETTLLFTVAEEATGDHREAVLVPHADGVAAWLNACQHMTHVALDGGEGAPMRDGELLCTNHGAYFDAATGLCTHGPCGGAYLEPVSVRVVDGTVRLVDDAYAFVRTGGLPTDDVDLASTSNVEF
ncbi:MAG: Rieske (2Fe-2S) protein [Halobacteriaceae archaeon]